MYRVAYAINSNPIESINTQSATSTEQALDGSKLPLEASEVQKSVDSTSNNRSLEENIEFYAKEYQIPSVWLTNLAKCESTMGKNLWGDNNKAFGVFQYHSPTWSDFERWSGMNLDRYSEHDQVKMTAWALSTGRGYNWSCNYKTGKVR